MENVTNLPGRKCVYIVLKHGEEDSEWPNITAGELQKLVESRVTLFESVKKKKRTKEIKWKMLSSKNKLLHIHLHLFLYSISQVY